MKERIDTIKRHEKNSGDELTEQGKQDAFISGQQFAIRYDSQSDLFVFHSPKNRAKQTANYFVEGLVTEFGSNLTIAQGVVESLLDVQGFSDEYRKNITPIAGRDKWRTEGILYVLKNDPINQEGALKGESNASCAGRIACYLLNYLSTPNHSNNIQTIGITHGPLPEHFLSHLLLENVKQVEPQKIIDTIGGGFDNGETFDVIRYSSDRGISVSIERAGKTLYESRSLNDLLRVANLK